LPVDTPYYSMNEGGDKMVTNARAKAPKPSVSHSCGLGSFKICPLRPLKFQQTTGSALRDHFRIRMPAIAGPNLLLPRQ
jgi:hypothetical protein